MRSSFNFSFPQSFAHRETIVIDDQPCHALRDEGAIRALLLCPDCSSSAFANFWLLVINSE
ncbi:MAG: hypothetical protein KME32_24455 [Mojavia pulchra JT2-VF2]|uniref:Uncharacterized protein n=1 Tax=Mojavia pulchra JT2-VF2 TaxID=287848 RepID=A0A951Q2T5_9NOST|nr:hypothetical protein [Mojavia pulchra JT2-VF2]